MSKVATVAVLGAGNRGGDAYGRYILQHPHTIKAVAVAEPDQQRREKFAVEHNIKAGHQFNSWRELLAGERLADGIIIATMDTMHLQPAVQAMEKGYKILLEKPLAVNWTDTLELARQAQRKEAKILVAHVLRYTPFYQKLKEILNSGLLGRIRFVDHLENIGYYHFAHSYVRGNWRNTELAAPIILAKSCHDLDLLYWLLGSKCLSLSSQASLDYFTASSKPAGSAERCLDCQLANDCPYSATKIYLTAEEGWPVSVISNDLSYQGRIKALREGPYGRCVYACDNNMPEVQTVNLTMENELSVNFALTAFSSRITRTTTIFGSKGELRADLAAGKIELDIYGGEKQQISILAADEGHGGGDSGLMDYFVKFLQDDKISKTELNYLTTIEDSLESHLMAFAAEESRREKRLVYLEQWRNQLERS